MPSMIKAVRCHRFAAFDDDGQRLAEPLPLREVLSIDEVAAPECQPGELIIRTHFAGVQYPDALQAQGLYQQQPELPYVPGSDVTGIVQEIGADVQGFAPGDRVYAHVGLGALSELVAARADVVWRIPPDIPLSHCTSLGRNYFPAYHSWKVLAKIGPGDLVLVDGASGGVGMAGIELAKALGAKVIAGVSTDEKAKYPAAVGADRVLTYGRDRDSYEAFKVQVKQAAKELGHPQGVDAVLDVVQGELFDAALVSCIRPLGTICLVGFTAGQCPIRPGLLLIKQAIVAGSLWYFWAMQHPEAHRDHVKEIFQFLETGKIQPRVDRIFRFDEYLDAFELFESNRGRGNTVVQLADSSS